LNSNKGVMNIATEKKALIKQFNEVQDVALLHAIRNLLKPNTQGKTDAQTDATHSLAYAPETIEINKRKYVLNYPLRCLFEKRKTIM